VTTADIILVSPAKAVTQFTATGYVRALATSRLAPKVAGRVLRSLVQQGDTVDANTVLIELDPADELAQINLADRQVETALAQLESEGASNAVARAELAEAKLRSQRARRLSESGVSAQGDTENLEAHAESSKRSFAVAQSHSKTAKARVAESRAAAEVLRMRLASLSIVAPFRGVIVNEPPRVGEHIGPQPPGVTVDMGGIRIADLSSLVVDADIPEGRFRLLHAGAPAEIVLDAYPDRKFRGRISAVTPEVDRAKATVRVKVAFTDAAPGVLPELAARVSFLSEEPEADESASRARKVVPTSSVVERDGVTVVFVVEQNHARMTPVRAGGAVGESVELIEGPPARAVVVTDVPSGLRDGDQVRVADAP
jgi:RND family efflux transporter MFP subunit